MEGTSCCHDGRYNYFRKPDDDQLSCAICDAENVRAEVEQLKATIKSAKLEIEAAIERWGIGHFSIAHNHVLYALDELNKVTLIR